MSHRTTQRPHEPDGEHHADNEQLPRDAREQLPRVVSVIDQHEPK
jgi:hypothetical protein